MPNTPDECLTDRGAAFRNLIKAAWRFLECTKSQNQLQNMPEYQDLARAMNEAAQANAKRAKPELVSS
jgi:hypothetical protein